MQTLMIGIIVVFCAILLTAWIVAERVDPKLIDSGAPRPVTKRGAGDA